MSCNYETYSRDVNLSLNISYCLEGSSLLALTRSDISAFVKEEQDKGLKPLSIISHLRGSNAFIAYLIDQEIIYPEIMKPKVRMQEADALPMAIPQDDVILHDQKILLYVGAKSYQGREVYYSADAELALKQWLPGPAINPNAPCSGLCVGLECDEKGA